MSAAPSRLRSAARAALLAGFGLAALPAAAGAQAIVNPNALDQLAPPPAGHEAHPAPKRTVRRRVVRRSPPHENRAHGGGLPNPHAELPGSVPAKPATAALPLHPPPAPNLPPPIVVPTRPSPPPPPVPVLAGAAGEAIPQKDGLRITFGAGSADLNPATDAAVRALAHTGPPFAATTFTITTYAAGNADDPSTPRRLSLSRGLAVRSVLIAEGVPSTRIYVRALGASVPPGDAPPDRADVAVVVPPPADQQQSQSHAP